MLVARVGSSHTQGRTCSLEQEDGADAALGDITTWRRLIAWHHRHAGCDDGSTAEGVFGVVAGLLSTRWPDLIRIDASFERDPTLHTFLMRHINTAPTADHAVQIGKAAWIRCPQNAFPLCCDIPAETRALIAELSAP